MSSVRVQPEALQHPTRLEGVRFGNADTAVHRLGAAEQVLDSGGPGVGHEHVVRRGGGIAPGARRKGCIAADSLGEPGQR
jgi:hypothetical protein